MSLAQQTNGLLKPEIAWLLHVLCLETWGTIFDVHISTQYRGPILRVTWPASGSDDLNLDQSGTSIQILPEPNAGHVTLFFIKLRREDFCIGNYVTWIDICSKKNLTLEGTIN